MAHVTADRVRDTSTTTGTGAFAVSGTAPTGYRTFSAVLATNDTCWYAIQHQTAAEWEVGLGTYSSANTITRTTVLASSNSGNAVSFSAGTKDVFITLAAGKTVQLDASGNASALGTVASATLTNATGLPISTGVSGLGTGVATFLATPSSANLASAVTDETGSGALVFGTSPSFTTSALFPDGAQSAPSIGHAGDTNTGFYFPAAGTIAASTSGAERLRITSAGNVGIGTTTLSTVSFRVTKNITGSTTAYLSRYDGTTQPDVTGSSYGSTVIVGTAANGGTPYTITNIFAYQSSQGTFNADSTVTNQYTFSVNANSTGATNNYGFHIGNTAAVTTGKTSYGFYSGINTAIGGGTTYQLYMAGTATSYINGNLGIGTTSPDALLTVNTIASFGDGAVTTPSIAHKGDLNTGFWFPAADTIAASTSGAERLRITSAGNVGIGTSSPYALLDVLKGDSSTTVGGSTSVVKINNNSGVINATSGVEFFHGLDTSSNASRLAGVYGQYTSYNGSGLGGALIFATNTAGDATIDERMRIDSSGNLTAYSENTNIGTATANNVIVNIGGGATGNKFSLTDYIGDTTYTDYGFRVGRDNGGANGTSLLEHRGTGPLKLNVVEAGYITLGTSATERLRITSAGNVGIGTSSPTYLLDVQNTSTSADYYAGRYYSAANPSGTSVTHLRLEKGAGYGGTVGGYLTQGAAAGLVFSTLSGGTLANAMWINNSGNVGIGTASFGTSAASVLGIATGTAPTTGPADTIQIYSTDLSAGNTMLSLYTEGTPVNANTTAAATHRVAIRVNGTVYYLLANTAA